MLSFVIFLWGSSFTLLKLGLDELPPITLAFLRSLIALPLLIVFAYHQDRKVLGSQFLQGWKVFSVLGLMGVTLYHVSQNIGLQLTTASNSSLIISSNPVFIALLDHLYIKERITIKRIVGIFMAFVGIVLVIRPLEWSLDPLGLIGDLLSLGAALCWAVYSVMCKKVLSDHESGSVTLYSMAYGTLFLFPVALVFERPTLPTSIWIWSLLLALSVFSSALAYLLWSKALENVSATTAGSFLFFLPVISISVAYFVLSEVLDTSFAIGAALVVIGVVMINC